MLTTLLTFVGALALALVATLVIVRKLIYICQPNEVLVFSGTTRMVGGRRVGYRLVQGGRGFRKPLLETVDRLDLTNMSIDVRVNGAYSKGGIPLNVAAVANVKIASNEPVIGNALERLLGKSRKDIVRIAKETLEGNLRGVLATLTPEEVNHDRVKFAQNLLSEADSDLKRLGLVLDTLKIQHVTDDKSYLDSIGRKQSAELLMRSRIAEAENGALAAERNAENFLTRSLARVDAEIEVARAEANRRIVDAETRGQAMIAEQRSAVTALVARARGEVDVQRERVGQVRLQLEADRIESANAKRGEMIAHARGDAATYVEDAKAMATSIRAMADSWRTAGSDASRIFVAQRLGTLVEQMLSTTANRDIDRVTVIDQQLEGGSSLAGRTAVTAAALKEGAGFDVPAILHRLVSAPALGRPSSDSR